MTDYNIFIAFANEKISYTVAKMLISEGMKPAAICTSISDLRKKLNYYQNGIIISGYKFKDGSIIQLVDDVPDNFGIVLIGNKTQIDLCEDDRVFKLAVPLQKMDLVCSVSMILNIQSSKKVNNITFRTDEEQKILQLAKETLIDRYGMTESQAHRYMQKKSMDTGTKLIEIAKMILN